jgi:formate dehydrogenase subunit delta
MTSEDMVRMANQIAAFFAPYPKDEALAGVTAHIRDFWEPRMKRQLAEHIAAGGQGLEPLVIEAAAALPKAA